MQDHGLALRLVSRDRLDHPFDDPALFAAIGTKLRQPSGELVGRLAFDFVVQHGSHPAQVVLRGGPVEVHNLLLEQVSFENEDDENRLGLE